MKVSIITSVYNNYKFIEDCILSITNQTYKNIEYIIIDGKSTDGTLNIIDKYKHKISRLISEKDEGIYDAMNKGLKMATGDIIGFLHSDDFYAHPRVIEKIVAVFEKKSVDSVYGDIIYIDRKDKNKILRYWKAGQVNRKLLKFGWAPPHPSLFIKKQVYEKYGLFKVDRSLNISADYEIILRFFYKYKVSLSYIPEVFVKMRSGGKSKNTFKNLSIKISQDYKAMKMNGINNPFSLLLKRFYKIRQFLKSNIKNE